MAVSGRGQDTYKLLRLVAPVYRRGAQLAELGIQGMLPMKGLTWEQRLASSKGKYANPNNCQQT
jgi:hypothetical protein